MTEPEWFTYEQAIAAHSIQLRRYGGAAGLRDEGALRSALDRPVNKWHYESAELPALAAAYAYGLAKNHPFVDGNKRVAFVVLELFLALNGLELLADDESCVVTMLRLAGGSLDESALAAWLRANTRSKT